MEGWVDIWRLNFWIGDAYFNSSSDYFVPMSMPERDFSFGQKSGYFVFERKQFQVVFSLDNFGFSPHLLEHFLVSLVGVEFLVYVTV